MANEISNLASSNLIRDIRARQSTVPSEKPVNQAPSTISESQKPVNVVPLESTSRQSVAAIGNSAVQDNNTQPAIDSNPSTSAAITNGLNRAIQVVQRSLEFRIDDASGRTVITVRDSDSEEVIRQIPSDQLLELSARLQEIESQQRSNGEIDAQGVLFTSKT